jgi:hypothetical protein
MNNNKTFTVVVSIPITNGNVTELISMFEKRINELILLYGVMSFTFTPTCPIGINKTIMLHKISNSFRGDGSLSIYTSPCGENVMGYIGATVVYEDYS